MRCVTLALVLVLAFTLSIQAQGLNTATKWSANYNAKETFSVNGNTTSRTFDGILYYEDTWTSPGNGYSRLRVDISLVVPGFAATTLTELSIYEDQYFTFTICNDKCTWQDIYAEAPQPRLHLEGETNSGSSMSIGGVNSLPYRPSVDNVVGIRYGPPQAPWVELFVETAAPHRVTRATIELDGVTREFTFIGSTYTTVFNSDAIFNVPGDCPIIEPSCFRLDLFFVIDVSGSVGAGGVDDELAFLRDLTEEFFISPKRLAVALISFSYCYNVNILQSITFDKSEWTQTITFLLDNLDAGGFTCIVGGVQRAFWSMATINGSRVATGKSLVVFTDGNGNRPCSGVGVIENPEEDCGIPRAGDYGTPQTCCAGCLNQNFCNAGTCCQGSHDYHLTDYYNQFYALYNPRIFAVGVGSSVSRATLDLIVNDPVAIGSGIKRVFQVGSFAELQSIIGLLSAALLCDIPGSLTCPNACRPGGFCCAGSCLCTEDCAAVFATECQPASCLVNDQGAQCQRGLPNDAACERVDIQCQDRFCDVLTGVCDGVPLADGTACDDFNLCTDESCLNGACVAIKNNATVCSDNNDCTENDECQPDGSCVGTPNDNIQCSDGDLCTQNVCFAGECNVASVTTCTDNDLTDCIVPSCDATTGNCTYLPVSQGFQCAPPDPRDNCTVHICTRFDPDTYNECVASAEARNEVPDCFGGSCDERTLDSSECRGSSDNIGAIIGGVAAAVALILICLLCLIIFLVILLRNQVADVLGVLNPFAQDVKVEVAGTYVDPGTSGTSGVYEG